MSKKVIRVSKENFRVIRNLNQGDLITIKHKNRMGKVILKAIDDSDK